jgi:hypothetical protein
MVDVARHTRRLGSALRASGDVHSERSVTAMDCAMHPLLAQCVRRRLFAISGMTSRPKSARPAGAASASKCSLGRRTKFVGGVVTPRPPHELPATYTWADPMRMSSVFLGLANGGLKWI